jgi:hypothetical protein
MMLLNHEAALKSARQRLGDVRLVQLRGGVKFAHRLTRISRLEPFGKRRKEFGETEGRKPSERARASPLPRIKMRCSSRRGFAKVDASLRWKNVPQNNSFSASDGEKVAGGRMR